MIEYISSSSLEKAVFSVVAELITYERMTLALNVSETGQQY